jgi:hypothetical protein
MSPETLPGLEPQASAVFKKLCEISVAEGTEFLQEYQIMEPLRALGLPDDDLYESLDMLVDAHFIDEAQSARGRIFAFRITTLGFQHYARAFLPGFEQTFNDTLAAIVQGGQTSNGEIARRLSQPKGLINYALNLLADNGYIQIGKRLGSSIAVLGATEKGKQAARDL